MKKWLCNWGFFIPIGIFTVVVIVSLTYILVVDANQHNRVERYCYGLGLPDLRYVHGSFYCVGIKENESVVVSVPDYVFRKE